MNIEQILKNAGVDVSLVDSIANAIKAEIPKTFVKKEQYNKKVQALDSLQEQYNDLEAKVNQPNGWEDKYKELESEMNVYKEKEVRGKKLDFVNSQLKEKGFTDDKVRKLITNGIDLSAITQGETGFEGFDVESVVNEYKDFVSVTTQISSPPSTPPANNPGKKEPKTLAEAMMMDAGLM